MNEATSGTSRSDRGAVPFEPIAARPDRTIEIELVVVPPRREGVAWGHDAAGRCVAIKSDRGRLLELFHRLRNAIRSESPSKVVIEPDERDSLEVIAPAECPIHALPAAEGPPASWSPY